MTRDEAGVGHDIDLGRRRCWCHEEERVNQGRKLAGATSTYRLNQNEKHINSHQIDVSIYCIRKTFLQSFKMLPQI
jgi:hypothetical protein